MNRTRLARRAQRGAFACAAVVAVIAVLPVGPAAANDPVPDTLVFSGAASAIGTQAMFDTNPEPSNVPDVFDLQVPVASSSFDSSGQADAVAHLANGNGATQVPGLLCLAGVPCDMVNSGLSSIPGGIVKIPPDDPAVAHATLPSPKHAEAPAAGGQVLPTSFSSDQAAVTVGHAIADVATNGTSSSATSAATQIPLVIAGGATTTTDQHIEKGALVTTATSTVSDSTIGELVQIKSVKVVASVSSTPGKAPVDTSSATAGGVTVAGMPATIDQNGLTVAGMNVNQVQGLLLTAGILDIRLVGVKSSQDDSGYAVSSSGISIKFDTNVNGIPVPAIPPQVVAGCNSVIGPDGPLGAITANIPVNACTGVGISPNAEYYGTMLLGQAGVLNLTATEDDSFDSDGGFDPGPTDSTPSDTPSSSSPSSTPAVTTDVTPPSSGDTGGAILSDPSQPITGGDATAPQVAGTGGGGSGVTTIRKTALGEDMQGVHKRLLWIYPVILLAALGILAGRFGKAPSRIPRTS